MTRKPIPFIATLVIMLSAAAIADDRIELTTGDTLTGRIVEATEEHIILEHAVLGTLTIPRDQIAAMPDLRVDPRTGQPIAAIVEEPAPPPPPRWESQIDLGFAGSRGNTDTLDVRAAFRTQHETDTDRWRIDAAYFYGESDGEKNKHNATAGILKDWLMPDSPWLLFAQGRYDFEEFREWKHRLSAHGGAGYEFIKTDELTLIGRIGAGVAKEFKKTQPLRPEGLIGGEVAWNISENQRLTAHTTLYPYLDDFFEFRWVSGVAWNLAIDKARGISLHLGIDNEYESSTAPGIKHNDLKYYGGISIGF